MLIYCINDIQKARENNSPKESSYSDKIVIMSVILVANDDGIHSLGIMALFRAMKELGDAYIIAPDRERSAASHSLTLHKPLKVEKINEYTYSINGTPTDCVILGVNKLLPEKPALVVSGINKGGNLGDDITYSGTVSAAIEGTIMGIPSFAISLFIEEEHASPLHFDTASDFAVKIGRYILEKSLPHNTLLNINVPNVPKNKILGVKFTRQGKMFYNNSIKDIIDPKGKKHYWIGGSQPYIKHGDNTDIQAIHEGYISITPVNIDLTNYKALEFLKNELSFLS